MLTVEEIKKGCDLAIGFKYLDDSPLCEYIEFEEDYGTIDIHTFMDHKIFYALFLQRIIEGINENLPFFFIRSGAYFDVIGYGHDDTPSCEERFLFFDSIDDAKERAIKYIIERM